MTELVLASTSKYRKELLQRLGVEFKTFDPKVDEAKIRTSTKDPIGLARSLALAKAESGGAAHKSAIVIGSDQVLAFGDEVLGKPGSAEAAAAQLERLQGNEHALITAVAVLHGKDKEEFVDVTMLRMRKLDKKTIARYVERDQPVDCAGSYKIEQLGIALFEKIQGEDHTAITGLPLLKVSAALRKFGLQVP